VLLLPLLIAWHGTLVQFLRQNAVLWCAYISTLLCCSCAWHIFVVLFCAVLTGLCERVLPQDHLSVYSLMDISLDTFPYSGGCMQLSIEVCHLSLCESPCLGMPCLCNVNISMSFAAVSGHGSPSW
jgi:hypothetical protein